MKFNSSRQLKDWIKNLADEKNIPASLILQSYMMERFLERISASKYRDHLILKGGLLISSMIGIAQRTTMDMDFTLIGEAMDEKEMEEVLKDVLDIDCDDHVMFTLSKITRIHRSNENMDFRLLLVGHFFNIKVPIKIDVTYSEKILPEDIDYDFSAMFSGKIIPIKAYPIYGIFAEKIESILARNISNTRARDYYDVYILFSRYSGQMNLQFLREAIRSKMEERGTLAYFNERASYLEIIGESIDLQILWNDYAHRFSYAAEITFSDTISALRQILLG